MLVSKSLLAIPYGTVFNGIPRPISRFDIASSIAATVSADKAGPQYERMARIAGTAVAAGSFGFGAVKLAALVSYHKGHHVAKIPFSHNDAPFNSTVVDEIPPRPIGPVYSFAAAYEASLLTSLAVVDPELELLPLSLTGANQEEFIANLSCFFNTDLVAYRPPRVGTQIDAAIDSDTVVHIASPTCNTHDSPSLNPTATSVFGDDKVAGTSFGLRHFLYALAFLTGLVLSTRPFYASSWISDEEEFNKSSQHYIPCFVTIDLSEEDDLESWIHNENLFKFPYIYHPFWNKLQTWRNPDIVLDSKVGIAPSTVKDNADNLNTPLPVSTSSSNASQQQCEPGEIVTVYDHRPHLNPMPPQLLVATVITPAILFCFQAMTLSEETEEGKDLVGDHEEEADNSIAAIEEGDDEASQEIQEDEEETGRRDVDLVNEIEADLAAVVAEEGIDEISKELQREEETGRKDADSMNEIAAEVAVAVVEERNAAASQEIQDDEKKAGRQDVDSMDEIGVETTQSEPPYEVTTDESVSGSSALSPDDGLHLSCPSVPSIIKTAVESLLDTEVGPVGVQVLLPDNSPPSRPAPALNAKARTFVPRRAACPPAAQPIQVYVGDTPYRPPRGARRGKPTF